MQIFEAGKAYQITNFFDSNTNESTTIHKRTQHFVWLYDFKGDLLRRKIWSSKGIEFASISKNCCFNSGDIKTDFSGVTYSDKTAAMYHDAIQNIADHHASLSF